MEGGLSYKLLIDGLPEAYPVIYFDHQTLLHVSLFFRSGAWTVVFFTVHEEHMCAVAVAVAQTHPLASYFLVRSSTVLRLRLLILILSGEQRCFLAVLD